jgi:hypothetical protein
MSKIADIVVRRRITEILHFSTNHGLTGILAEGAILPRQCLPQSKYIEHVYKPNAPIRRDGPWLDYVNLSISRLNTTYFSHSTRWHQDEDVWWCALAFAPAILDHKDVLFATTNNMYTGCHRQPGPEGLESLFAEQIEPWGGNTVRRPDNISASWPTCRPRSFILVAWTAATFSACTSPAVRITTSPPQPARSYWNRTRQGD